MTRHLPEIAAPKAVRQALQTLRAAEDDLIGSQEAEREAEAAQQEAIALDRQALADARTTGSEPPGRVHRERAEHALVDAVEVREADELRVTTAEQALAKELDAQAEAWLTSIEKARERADAEAVKRLEALREVESQRRELRSAAAWLRRLSEIGFDAATTRPPKPVADLTTFPDPRSAGEVLRASAVLDVLGDYLRASSLAGERKQIAQWEAEAAEEERRLAELREVREAHPPLAS
jgi:hypothetical protein